jgi:hypothetical protein
MQRVVAMGLGVGLVFLGFWAMVYHAPLWLAWLNGLAGVVAIGVAGASAIPRRAAAAIWGALALLLFVLWLGARGLRGAGPTPWWSFGFACGFVALALSALVAPTQRPVEPL